MKTNRATGLAFVVAFTTFGGVAVMPGCSGNQADVSYGPDGAIVTDASVTPPADTGTGTGPGTGIPDAPISTFIDTGTSTSTGTPDTGIPTGTPDTGTPTTDAGGGGTCPPATCSADSDCSCLSTSGSIGCCDTVTTACFQSASAMCPDQGGGGGGGTDSGTGPY